MGGQQITKKSDKPKTGGNGYSKEESNTVKQITDAAEKAHKILNDIGKYLKEHPNQTEAAIMFIISPTAKAISLGISSNPKDHSWGDLFMIWLFELENGVNNNEIIYNDVSKTTLGVRATEGANDARKIAIARAQVGNFNPVSVPWTFGVQAAKDAVKNKNIVTAFLGSFSVNVQACKVNAKSDAISLSFSINNTSSWDSATRFRKDINGDGYHDGMIANRTRREQGLKLGGNLKERWTWKEYIPSFIFDKNIKTK